MTRRGIGVLLAMCVATVLLSPAAASAKRPHRTTPHPAPVTGLVVKHPGATADVQWTLPNRSVAKVVVAYGEGTQPLKRPGAGSTRTELPGSATKTKLNDLTADTTYSIAVWTTSAKGALSAAATTTFTTAAAETSKPLVTGTNIGLWILGFLAFVVVGLLYFFVRQGWSGGQLLAVPYMAWNMLHLTIAALGIIATTALSVAHVLDSTGTSALLGSLFGYVLGTAKSSASSSDRPAPDSKITITKMNPASGPAAGGMVVHVTGTNFPQGGQLPKVMFGEAEGTGVSVINSSTIAATAPQRASGPGAVNVIVTVGSVDVVSPTKFTYT
jgi:hypothetical protein